MEEFLVWSPPPPSHMPQCTGNCSFASYFPLNILSFTTPLPHRNFQWPSAGEWGRGGGYGYFLELHNYWVNSSNFNPLRLCMVADGWIWILNYLWKYIKSWIKNKLNHNISSSPLKHKFPPKIFHQESNKILRYKEVKCHPWIFSAPLQDQVPCHQTFCIRYALNSGVVRRTLQREL